MTNDSNRKSKRQWGDLVNWHGVTREERHFCAHLFECVRKNPCWFIELLSEHTFMVKHDPTKDASKLDSSKYKDTGFEVAFYRDLRKRGFKFPKCASSHRKFDLALFFDDRLVIVEAKAQQGFRTKELENIKNDVKEITNCPDFDPPLEIKVVGIASSKWYCSKNRDAKDLPEFDVFDYFLTWNLLAEKYQEKSAVFERANCIYGK